MSYKIFEGMEKVNQEMAKKIEDAAPCCHLTKMNLEYGGDYQEGSYESWWECKHCGHTKPI